MNDQSPSLFAELARLTIWLIVLTVVFVPLEAVFALQPRKLWRQGCLLDLAYYFISSLTITFLMAFPVALLTLTTSTLVPDSLPAAIALWPSWLSIAGGFLASECGYYWGHRLSHEIPWLWNFHCVHHSSPGLDYLSNSRAHPVDMIFSRFCSIAPLYLLGFGNSTASSGFVTPAAIIIVSIVWGFFIHSNIRWRYGFLEKVIATPPFHHWHHSAQAPLDKNYSTSLPVFDIIFGTFHLPRDQWPTQYGIDEPIPETLIGQLTHPFIDTDSACQSAEQAPNSSDYSEPAEASITKSSRVE